MDLLAEEINKLKRKAPIEQNRTFVKRGDLKAKHEEEYREQQKQLHAAKEAREAEKLARIEEYETNKRLKQSAHAAKSIAKEEQDVTSIQAELRELKEPIRLFGEETNEIRNRLQQVKAKHKRLMNSTQALLNEVFTDPVDEQLPTEDTVNVVTAWVKSANEEEKNKLQESLFLLFRIYIRDWQTHLDSSDDREGGVYKQAREHLARLLLRLKVRNLPSDILRNLSNVAIGLKMKDYTAANHAYLQMSIGKATWPVGVTMVGIHERAQRQRVNKVTDSAHILSDEITRQWLQSLKRLITHRERHFVAD